MLLLWFLILSIIGAVNCDEFSENYILEILDGEITKTHNTPFKVYWNVPTKQCRYQKKSIPFDDILRKYSISYNKDDKFEGETITIIYNGGFIPAILKRDGAKFSVRNGGLPQEGDLELHLTAFRETVIRLIPDPHFQGVGVIDMESWRPIFRQHWSKLASIIDLSLSIEKRHYWWWPSSWLKMEATKRFEDAARIFMEKTLSTAKQMRPKAVWGYYGFPYCYNMGTDMKEHCSTTVKAENDRTYWLWAESTALYPSLYSSSEFSTSELEALVRGRLTEANRVKQAGTPVLPYFWIKYRDGDFIKQRDLIAVFEVLQKKNASGLVIWGASEDVNQVEKCKQLYNYINNILGPIAKKYIQRINKDRIKADSKNLYINGTFNNTNNINSVTTQKAILDTNKVTTANKNLITTEKLESTSFIYEQEQLQKYYYGTGENKTYTNNSNESDIWNIIPYEQNFEEENKAENNTNIERYLSTSITKTIANKNSSLNNYISKENLLHSSNRFNNISDNLVKIFGNTNSSTFLITNNTESNIFNDSINTAGNLMDSMKTLVLINVTKINKEADPEINHIIREEEEQQLNKYYYETDSNKTGVKSSNESNIWNIENFNENDTESAVNSKYTEPSYMNKTTFNENNIDSTIKITKNVIQTISNDLAISLVNLTKTLKSSENKNSSEIVTTTDPVPTWFAYENYTKDVNIFEAKRNLINGSFHNNEETVGAENKIFEDSVTSSVNLISVIDKQVNSNKISTTKNVIISNNNYTTHSSQSTLNDSVNTAGNLTNSVKTSVIINATKIITKTDPDIVHIMEEEQQLSRYYNDTVSNKTGVQSSNESNNQNIVKENLEHENNNESVVNLNYTETSSMNPSKMNKTTFNENNFNPIIAITKNVVQNITNDLPISLVNLTKTLNSSEHTNNTEIVRITDPVATWSKNDNSKDVNSFDAKRRLIDGSFHNIEETVNEKNNIFDDSVTSSVSLASPIDIQVNSYKIGIGITENIIASKNNYSIYSSQEEVVIESTTYQNIAEIDTRENDISDYLITIDANFNRSINTPVEKTHTETIDNLISNISQNFKQEELLIENANYQYIGTPDIRENDISDYLITTAVNFTSPTNMSVNGNDDTIAFKNLKSINRTELNLLPSDYFERNWKEISENLAKKELIIQNTTYPNIEATISTENDISDDSLTSTEKISSITISINGNDTDIKENVKLENSLDFKSANYSEAISQYIKLDEQTINVTTDVNFKALVSNGIEMPNYLIILAEDTNQMDKIVNSNATKIKENVSQNVQQEDELNQNFTKSSLKATASTENDISDYLIIMTRNTSSPLNTNVKVSNIDKEKEYKEVDENYSSSYEYK